MADYGMKISKPGYDVKDATDAQLVYSSKFDTIRVFTSGSGTITVPNPMATQTVTISHNLGYRPAFAVYSQIYDVFAGDVSSGHFMMPYADPWGGDASIMPYVSTTQLLIRYGAVHAPAGTQLNYRYFIYYNRAI
jgi:hypothetical protein